MRAEDLTNALAIAHVVTKRRYGRRRGAHSHYDDRLSDAMLEAVRSLSKYREGMGASLSTYVFRNVCLRLRGPRGKRKVVEEQIPIDYDAPATERRSLDSILLDMSDDAKVMALAVIDVWYSGKRRSAGKVAHNRIRPLLEKVHRVLTRMGWSAARIGLAEESVREALA